MAYQYFYNVQGQEYTESQEVKVPFNCNGMTAINRGDGVVTINGIPLSPNPTPGNAGESIAFGGNQGEVFGGRCNIAFAPGQTDPRIILVFKFYVNPQHA